MNLVVIDIGNSNTSIGCCENGRVLGRWDIGARVPIAEDFEKVLGGCQSPPSRVVMSSVAPSRTELTVAAVIRFTGLQVLRVRDLRYLLKTRYQHPETLGEDRIANAVAGYERAEGACIVVDIGTATTFECVNKDGVVIGGLIAPGPGICADALRRAAPSLPAVALGRVARLPATSTEDALAIGITAAHQRMIASFLEELREGQGDVPVYITGGLASSLYSEAKSPGEIVDDLTLQGLCRLGLRHSEATSQSS